jgi:DEAD/DEAH box helicase domain-containing protein
MHDTLLSETRRLIAGCPCDHGCPTCVGPAGESGARAKAVALAILTHLLDGVPA